MPADPLAMPLAFSASQQLSLRVPEHGERLPAYLLDEDRVIGALLNPTQLEPLGPGHYRYTVSRFRVFQLQVQPIVELRSRVRDERLELEAVDCRLEGLGLVEDFRLGLDAWLGPRPGGMEGEATLAVNVSRPPLLRLVPETALEATGRSVLSGILLGIKARVRQQLVADFRAWCAAG